jgi:hypothetical protein
MLRFSNSHEHPSSGIQDFSFNVSISLNGAYDFSQANNYIHYYNRPSSPTSVISGGSPVFIPFINDARVSITYNSYGTP